ncbi:unnamed protein product, partial [Ectocarpus fasciculatus]
SLSAAFEPLTTGARRSQGYQLDHRGHRLWFLFLVVLSTVSAKLTVSRCLYVCLVEQPLLSGRFGSDVCRRGRFIVTPTPAPCTYILSDGQISDKLSTRAFSLESDL